MVKTEELLGVVPELVPSSTPPGSGKWTSRSYQKHGLAAMKKALHTLGTRAIDRRTSLGKTLDQWQADLIADLGGK